MAHDRSIRDLDWTLLIVTLSLCALGVLQIYSSTRGAAAWWKQIVWIAFGLLLMWVVASIDYHTLLGHVPVLYGLTLFALLATFIFGEVMFHARRWIPLGGGFRFQTSEFAKLVIILLIARYLSEVKADHLEARDLLKLGGLVGCPMLLVLLQPDLGTALTYMSVLVVGVFLAGLRWQHAVAIVLLAALTGTVGWHFLHDYQKKRVLTFVNPDHDPRGDGWQIIQSKIAVGHGGMWGKGVTQGSQARLQFLPVPYKDFIVSAFAEEHGFVGIVVVLGLYFLLLMQIVQNAQAAPDRAGMYLAMGVAAMLLFHMVNVGMVVGLAPVVGIPLPLMSYGGSNMLSVFMMLGLVNSVRLRRFVN